MQSLGFKTHTSREKLFFFFLVLFHVIVLPAGFKAFELLDKEVLQNFGTLVEG